MVQACRRTEDGFEIVELANDFLRIAIVPELGAKIVSLLNLRTGREWMWRPGRVPKYFRVPTGTSFDQGPFLGADECLPTIAPCRWRSRDLPDHGEVWSEAWQLDEAGLVEGRMTTRLRTPISPLSFERTIHLNADNVHLDYQMQNLSDEPFEYLWALHPMMNIAPGDQIVLPETCRRVQTEAAIGCPLGKQGDSWDWPRPTTEIDLSQLNLNGENCAVKLFTEPLVEGHAAIINDRTGERLSFYFDPKELNTLGIWINRGGYGGFHHVALEPGNAAPDSLETAVRDWKRYGVVGSHETSCWRVTIQASTIAGNHA